MSSHYTEHLQACQPGTRPCLLSLGWREPHMAVFLLALFEGAPTSLPRPHHPPQQPQQALTRCSTSTSHRTGLDDSSFLFRNLGFRVPLKPLHLRAACWPVLTSMLPGSAKQSSAMQWLTVEQPLACAPDGPVGTGAAHLLPSGQCAQPPHPWTSPLCCWRLPTTVLW